MDEIFPVGGPVYQANLAAIVSQHAFVQSPTANSTQKVMNLINGERSSSRIIDCWGECFCGDVHYDSKRQRRVLLVRTFLSHRDTLAETARSQGFSILIHPEQRIAGSNEISHLRHQLD